MSQSTIAMDAKSSPSPWPPETVEDLRELVMRIGRSEGEVTLGARAYSILAQLVEKPEQAAVRSISELANLSGVNPSTLTRLAKRLGYGGFGQFQDVFRRAIADEERYFYSRQAGRLLASSRSLGEPVGTIEQLARESIGNIESALQQLQPDAVKGMVKLLAHAPRVRIHGLRQFHSLASFLAYALGMLRRDVGLLGDPYSGIAEALAQLDEGDVIVVASCAPYTRSVADVARTAQRRGLSVLAITDSPASPLARAATHSLFVPHASSFYSNSTGAYFIVCEGLLNLVAKALGKRALGALEAREQVINEMKIEVPR